ncbi:hypothetical protein GQ457_11G000950 [Hibiscus cannabinus]
MGEDKGTVCVTGGTGFVASWLIKALLHEGYSVHTTVRADPGNKRDLSFLTSLPGADEKLKIFTADLDVTTRQSKDAKEFSMSPLQWISRPRIQSQ